MAFHLTNVSQFATPRDTDISADAAAARLEDSADFGEPLPFEVDVGGGVMVSPIFISRDRGRNMGLPDGNRTCDNVCPTTGSPMTTEMMTDGPTTTMQMTTNQTSTSKMTGPTDPSTTEPPCTNNIINSLGLSDGVVAGIGIGLFFLGFFAALISLLVCYICCKCLKMSDSRDVSSVKYKKHDNELESI